MASKLDILAVAAHPDDVELGCAGTLLAQISLGKSAGIIDLTRGELGTRGTPEGRILEAKAAAEVLGISIRENLGLADGFFRNDKESQLKLIQVVRKFRPDIILTNAPDDRHPDHGRASQLVLESCFYSGLRHVETFDEKNQLQTEWRPKQVFHFIQDRHIKPNFVVDITPYMNKKIEAMLQFKSQFFSKSYDSNEPQSYISSAEFLEFIKARAQEMGHSIGVAYGEGFLSKRALGINDLSSIS